MGERDYDVEEAMFLSVIYSFHAAAMQQMGKLANPLTGKIEKNLGAARGAIDTLMVLQKRTRGNLTDLENRTLSRLIQELQLNYVDEVKRAEAPAPTAEERRETTEREKPPEPAPDAAPKKPEKKPEAGKKTAKKRKEKSAGEKNKPSKKKE